ncbi:MAG: 30S ribosomal protein S6 [Deltaproteobacteria bacterium]|nr:30S ribosomal protein S6 [Deltaproteobacteria bacterium]
MAKAIPAGRVLSQRAQVGTQREYESVTIIRPETSRPEIGELIARMQEVITSRGAKLMKIDSWGTRVLAFPISHCRKGIYLYWRFIGGSDIVAEFERLMGLFDKVLRFYTVLVDEDIDPEARPSEVTEELLEAATDPGPDPDDLARQAAAEAAQREAENASRRERGDVFEGEEEFNAEGDL